MDVKNILTQIDLIDTSSLVDKVEKRIIDLIIDKNIQIGESLPKELELAASFGVSRTVIREALLRLRMIGLIDSKKHKGAVLTNPDVLQPLKKVFQPGILNDETLRELFEMRLALEVGLADFIFDRIKPEDIVELEEIIKDDPEDAGKTFEIQKEIAFHSKLYAVSGNKVIQDFQSLLLPIFQYVQDSGILEKPIVNAPFTSHNGLVEILKNGSADEFREGMRRHLNNHFNRLFKN